MLAIFVLNKLPTQIRSHIYTIAAESDWIFCLIEFWEYLGEYMGWIQESYKYAYIFKETDITPLIYCIRAPLMTLIESLKEIFWLVSEPSLSQNSYEEAHKICSVSDFQDQPRTEL